MATEVSKELLDAYTKQGFLFPLPRFPIRKPPPYERNWKSWRRSRGENCHRISTESHI